MLPVARADEFDQASKLTFSQPVQIPGRVLPAGTYWFVLANSIADRNIIQVFNSDRSMLYATVLTIAAEHPQPFDHTAITFAERGSMQPETMVTWFYPGNPSGHEFVYAKPEKQELARAKQQTIMAMAPDEHQTAKRNDHQIVVIGD
jgi:hypothetical protein